MKEYSVKNLVETNSFVYQFSAFTTVFSMMSATSRIRLAVSAALHRVACLDVSEAAAVLSPLVGDAGKAGAISFVLIAALSATGWAACVQLSSELNFVDVDRSIIGRDVKDHLPRLMRIIGLT